MTDPESGEGKGNADEDVLKSPLLGSVGKEHPTLPAEAPRDCQETSKNSSPNPKPSRVLRIFGIPRRVWEGIKHADSNRVIAIATVFIAVSAIAQYCETRSSGKKAGEQTDRMIKTANEIECALITANRQNSDAVNKSLAQNQRQFDLTLIEMQNQSSAMKGAAKASADIAEAAKKANNTAKQAMEIQTRPWIGISDVTFHLEIERKSITFLSVTTASIRNYGFSPAHRVGIVFEAREGVKVYATWLTTAESVCEKAEQQGSSKLRIYTVETIFPDPKGIAAAYPIETPRYMEWADAYVIGCIAYQSPINETWHHTRFLYGLPTTGEADKVTGLGQLISSKTD